MVRDPGKKIEAIASCELFEATYSKYLYKMKLFFNIVTEIVFELKLYCCMCYRFIQYNPTSLERNYKYEVLTEHDLGVTIDLINRETYSNDHVAQLDPADEKLLEEDVLTPQDSKR